MLRNSNSALLNAVPPASMPAMIRESGKTWGPDGKLHDTKAVIPDRSYARLFQTVIEDCKARGGYLAVFEQNTEADAVISLLALDTAAEYWLGLTCEPGKACNDKASWNRSYTRRLRLLLLIVSKEEKRTSSYCRVCVATRLRESGSSTTQGDSTLH